MALARDERGLARRRRRRPTPGPVVAALACAWAGCGDEATVVVPVIDLPFGDVDATAAPLDEITLTVAHAGSDRDLVSQTFARGEALALPGVPFGDDLVIHMSGFIGASNVAYGRTCAVEVAGGRDLPQPHLFFSRNVKFATVAAAPLPRIGGLGVSYVGSALFIGGSDGTQPVPDVEVFDPATGQLTSFGPVSARAGAVHALVGTAPPRVVVVGGAAGSTGAAFIEVLDGRSVERMDLPDMGRVDLTATALTDGRVMVIGGKPPGGSPSNEIHEIAPSGATLEVRRLNVTLAHARSGHTATRLGDDVGAPVLIAGGIDAAGAPVAAVELFRPLNEDVATVGLAPMRFPRRNHVATLMPDGSVLVIGGLDAAGAPVQQLELFSLTGGFQPAGELPAGAGVIDFAVATLPDGRILITGGRLTPSSMPSNRAYIARLDLLDGSVDVVPTDNLATPRAGHQAVVLCDGTVLINGGTSDLVPAERYNPPPLGRR